MSIILTCYTLFTKTDNSNNIRIGILVADIFSLCILWSNFNFKWALVTVLQVITIFITLLFL